MSAHALVLVVAIATVTVLSMGMGTIVAHPVVQVAPAAPGGVSAPPANAVGGPGAVNMRGLAIEQRVLATAKADHIPMAAVSLPNLLGQAKITNGVVSPITTVAPAPMGIGTFGVENTTGTPTAYTIVTNSWEGTITLGSENSFWLDNDGALTTAGTDNTFGVQLNAVTVNTTVNNNDNYSFWTQNVVYWNLIPGYITFLDNVWNFSSSAVSLTSGTIQSGNGTPVYPVYYYDVGPSFPVTLPAEVHIYLNSSVTNNVTTGDAYTTIRFGYDIINTTSGLSQASGVYDTVLFNSTQKIGTVPVSPFFVSGSQLTPTHFLLYDAEIMIGGPGGGTTTSFYAINGTESLQFWNASAGAYQNPPSAWNVGTDTGETSEGIAETYSTPGTITMTAGPSFPMPFWNATPGGNVGSGVIGGPISPTNAFVFFTEGSHFNTSLAAWAPTQTSPLASYTLPPGTYTVDAMLSDYKMIQTTATVTNGKTTGLHFILKRDTGAGVYTPLFAWDNAQLATISISGSGTALAPYTLDNNGAKGGLNPVFGEMNDYLYQVFPAVLLAGTTAHVDITGHASVFDVTYPAIYFGPLAKLGLPKSNEQQIELYDASNVAVWQLKDITGWFFYEDYGPTGLLPLANVVIFGGTHDLVGHSLFYSQGSSLLLADIVPGSQGNIVWGNTFLDSSVLAPTMYPGNGVANGPPVGIFAFESGDLIYNNFVATTITAYAPNANFYYGTPQLNTENWNLTNPEPKSYTLLFDGQKLKGTIVPSAAEGGNYWINYVAAAGLPYNNSGFIAVGGDYYPLPLFEVKFSMSGVFPVTWSVYFDGQPIVTTSGHTIVFFASDGTYSYTDAVVVGGGTIVPASGSVTVSNAPVHVALKHT